MVDVGNGWPVAGDLVAHVTLAVDNLSVSGGIGHAIANGRRPGVQRPLDIASKDHNNVIVSGMYRFRRQGPHEQKQKSQNRNRRPKPRWTFQFSLPLGCGGILSSSIFAPKP